MGGAALSDDSTHAPADDEAIDALYVVTPSRFVAARDALVRRLRGDGRREEARAVAALRRPTMAAWAINTTVRANQEQFDALVDAGDAVRRAQRRALSGVRQSGLRAAGRSRHARIDELTDLAVEILEGAGVNATAQRAAISDTFAAASIDDDARQRVAEARLTRPLAVSTGFSGFDGLTVMTADNGDRDATAATAHDFGTVGQQDADAGTASRSGAASDRRLDAARERAAQQRRDAMREVAAAQRDVDHSRRMLTQAVSAAETAVAVATTTTAAADQAARRAAELAEQAERSVQHAEVAQHAELEAREILARRSAALAERQRVLDAVDSRDPEI